MELSIPDMPVLFPIVPGEKLKGDWFNKNLPVNISVGINSVIDSSFCFKQFFSVLPTGLRIGNNVTIWRASLAAEENGIIEIGDYCFISNASIVCSEKISIGNRVFIAGGVTIADSDFHPLEPAARLADIVSLSPDGDRKKRPVICAAPVIIGDDVWIGYNAAILKGVHIGKGAYIEPGSVVISDIPEGITVSGNPARPVNQQR